jgi:hypothetical protein
MMSQDEVTKVWSTKWGTGQTAFFSGEITTSKASDLELFEGAEKAEVSDKPKNKRNNGTKGEGPKTRMRGRRS